MSQTRPIHIDLKPRLVFYRYVYGVVKENVESFLYDIFVETPLGF